MAHKFTAQERLTHTYVDSCSHLDQWGDDFTFTEYPSQPVSNGNGYDDRGSIRFLVKGDEEIDQQRQQRVLRDHYSYGGCTHEYDCCGCASVSAYVTPVKPGLFSVLLNESRNY